MREAIGYRRRQSEHGEKPCIGRGSGMTLRELNKRLNEALARKGINDIHGSNHSAHIWKRGRANRGDKNAGQALKVPKAFKKPVQQGPPK